MKTYTFQPRGVCSREMQVDLDDQGVIQDLRVVGGCHGNLQGIAALEDFFRSGQLCAALIETFADRCKAQ